MNVQPDLVRRAGDLGWLALSPEHAVVKIGVTAETEDEAVVKFEASYARWLDILGIARIENYNGDGI